MKFFSKLIKFPIFGILFGVFPLLALWNYNKTQVYPRDVWFSVLLTLGFVVVVWGLCLLLYRSAVRASLAAAAVFALFFSFGHVYNLVKDQPILGISIGFVKLLAVYGVVLIALLLLVRRIKPLAPSSVVVLNSIMLFLMLFNIIPIAGYAIQKGSALRREAQSSMPAEMSNGGTEALADIYYIVLDAYSRQDLLLELMDYDNSAFINGLRERGFYVADCANSNYGGTVLSMTSALNYSYLEDISPDEDISHSQTVNLVNNRIRSDLKAYGYQFVTSRAFSSENDIPNADIYLNVTTDSGMQDRIAQSQFAHLYLETTLIRAPIELYYLDPERFDILPGWLVLSDVDDDTFGYSAYWYYQTKYVFDSIEKFPQMEGNYFVYAHINAPHGPYVFDEFGNYRYNEDPEKNLSNYKDTVTYLNKRVLEVVDNLIEDSDVPPLIILQSDHAAHVIATAYDKVKILSAFYFPPEMQANLYDTITPVNTFRLILRDYFHQEIDLLPDKAFVKVLNDHEYYPSACDMSLPVK
jgi:hypothetical protein